MHEVQEIFQIFKGGGWIKSTVGFAFFSQKVQMSTNYFEDINKVIF
jgi:hypothetical protein